MHLSIEQNKATSLVPGSPDPSQERVLYAFSNSDRAQFFPAYPDALPGEGDGHHWIDTGKVASPDYWADYLKELRPTVMVSCWSTPTVPASLLFTDALPLRYLCHTTGTVRAKVPREFIASGGLVTNWGNTISHNVAEHALLLILASLRNLGGWRKAITTNNGSWGNAKLLQANSLKGRSVGIHGFGNVVRELLRLLEPFDVECRAYSQGVSPDYMKEKGVIPCDSLNELFQASDVVVECEALTPQSAGTVREEHFRLMPEGAVFVNVGRGAVVDEKAMIRVATEGRVRIASDVFENEPLPVDTSLLDIEGVIVSPHIAGPAGDWFHRCGDHALDNVDRYLKGQSLTGLVTLEIYDRTT